MSGVDQAGRGRAAPGSDGAVWPLEETLVRAADLAVAKWTELRERPVAFGLKAFTGGAMVAFGAFLSLSVSAGITVPGLANLVMGAVFGFSLVIIMVAGASLITADMALGVVALWHRRLRWREYLTFVLAGYLGNAAGSWAFMGLVAAAAGPYAQPPWLLQAHLLAVKRLAPSDASTFALGVLCTWLLQTAMFLYLKARTDVGKMILAYYGPLAFVAGMTEHAIANIGFLALPLLMQPRWAALVGPAAAHQAWLTWGFGPLGWARNQLFTLLGNFVGGAVFVATVFQGMADRGRLESLYRRRRGALGGEPVDRIGSSAVPDMVR
ncbi:MAG: formate/nitrite transporter family protein [Actinomycetia bacterium]|nr:formate/nitrite transporter family protein [Actinomycetes bacterium]